MSAVNTDNNTYTGTGEGENGNTNGGNNTNNASSSFGAFSGYFTIFIFVLNLLFDALVHVSIFMFITMLSLGSLFYVNILDVYAYIIKSMLMFNTFTRSFNYIHVMCSILIFWIKICRFMTKFSTIQKLDRYFSVVGFAASLKPHAFDGSNYKRWKARALLWLTVMHCFFVSRGKPSEPPLSPEEEAKFEASDCLFRGALISVLADNIVDVYMHMPSGKDMWDALEAKFGVSDVSSKL